MLNELLEKVFSGESLSREEASRGMEIIKAASASAEQMGAFLGALRTKGESPAEVAGFASSLLKDAIEVPVREEPCIDCCGTGGDGSNTFNISTTVAFVLAGGGVHVAKHGNRSVSSKCGSADVLEALGVPVDLGPTEVAKAIDEDHFGFIFAPRFHPAVKAVMPVRRALGVRTVFNLLGPLINPAKVKRQVVGVYSPKMTGIMAEALAEMGSSEVMVVSSLDGLDEISLSDETAVAHLIDGQVRHYRISPEQAGLSRAPKAELAGGEVEENKAILLEILGGQKGPRTDIVLLNAAAGFLVAGLAEDLKAGVERARQVIQSGQALAALEKARKVP